MAASMSSFDDDEGPLSSINVTPLVDVTLVLLIVFSAAAVALKSDVKKFALAFTAVFSIAYASWIAGNYANFAAVTAAELEKASIRESVKISMEAV